MMPKVISQSYSKTFSEKLTEISMFKILCFYMILCHYAKASLIIMVIYMLENLIQFNNCISYA